jgi:general secretion pathway protein M
MTLGKREKIVLAVGISFVTIYLIIQFIIQPLLQWQHRLSRSHTAKVQTLTQMQQLNERFHTIGSRSMALKNRLSKRKQGFTLFSFLDRQAGQTGIKENITYMKPLPARDNNTQLNIAAVEMKLASVSMKQLVDFLYRVETSPNIIWIKNMSIQQTGGEEIYIDVVLMVETLVA